MASTNIGSAAFRNDRTTQNQAGVQNYHGPVNYYSVTNGDGAEGSGRISRPAPASLSAQLDHDRARTITSQEPEIHERQEVSNEDILTSLLFPQTFERRSNVETPHTNTCLWIIEDKSYKQWKSGDYGMLWIKGNPGAGKSTMMKFMHTLSEKEHSGSVNVDLDFFFNAQGVALEKTCLGMMRSLLYQTYDKDPHACLQVKASFERKRAAAALDKQEVHWQLQELQNLFLDVLVPFSQSRTVTIFIDALDEAGAEEFDGISEYIVEIDRRMRTVKAKVKICISCRHYPITDLVSGARIDIDKHNAADITTYINDTLPLGYIGSSDYDAWQKLKDELVLRALGVFRWARLVAPMMKRKIGEGESPEEVRKWLQNVPRKLSNIYKDILLNVIAADKRPASFALLQWITLGMRPLSLTELRHALAAQKLVAADVRKKCEEADGFIGENARMKRLVVTLSGGLAETLNQEQRARRRLRQSALDLLFSTLHDASFDVEVVELVHQSVAEFLESEGLAVLAVLATKTKGQSLACEPLDTTVTVQQGHALLFRACLHYLITEDLHSEQRDYYGQELRKRLPFITYAANYVFEHARQSGDHYLAVVVPVISELELILLQWIEIYKLLNRFSDRTFSTSATLLHVAAAMDLVDLTRFLITEGVKVDSADEAGNTALHYATQWGRADSIKYLMQANARADVRNKDRITPLAEAAGRGDLPIVKLLLDSGADAENKDFEGSALEAAINGRYVAMVQFLLHYGADVNGKGAFNRDALQAAAYNGSAEAVSILLDRGAEVNARGGKYGSALRAAVLSWWANEDVPRMLIQRGADVSAADKDGWTPLHGAVGKDLATAKLLHEAGGDIEARANNGGTLLYEAAANGQREIVEWLLSLGADVSAADTDGLTPLHGAATKDLATAKVLHKAGGDVKARANNGRTVLYHAAASGQHEIVEWLLSLGADVSAADKDGWTPLHGAATRDLATAKVLHEAGGDIEARANNGGTLLYEAAANGQREIVEWLLSLGADASTADTDGLTPLHGAATKDLATVKVLHKVGGDIETRRKNGRTVLYEAAVTGQREIVEWLLSQGADVSAADKDGWTPLHGAATKDLATAKMLHEAGGDIETRGNNSGTVLYEAAANGQREIVEWLLSLGADVSAADTDGWTPLHGAAGKDLATAKLLREVGGDIEARRKNGRTVLYEAAVNGQREIVEWLLSLGADVLAADKDGWTSLHGAATKDLATAKVLHEAGGDIEARGNNGGTVLYHAAANGQREIVEWLLSLGADVSAVDTDGWTPLHGAAGKDLATAKVLHQAGGDIKERRKNGRTVLYQAAVHGQREIVEWLLSLGADVSAADTDGWTPLHGAAGKDLATAKVLHKAGGDIKERRKNGRTVLYEAAVNGQREIVEWLLSLGADVSAADTDGWTPLHGAATKDLATAKVLHEAGGDIKARRKNGRTVLYEAAANGQREIVEWLLSLGADVSAVDTDGWTPLHGAATKDLATAKVLHEAGGDIEARGNSGGTMLYEAAVNGQREIVEWLLSLGADVSAVDTDGWTPLHGAATKDLATAKVLHEAGGDIEARRKNGRTVLYTAAASGQCEIVEWLLSLEVDVLAIDTDGWTPLHGAATKDLATAKVLHKAGGDIKARANNGGTMLYHAAASGQREIVEWLLSLGADVSAADKDGWTPLHGAATKDLATAKVLHKAGGDIEARANNSGTVLYEAAANGQREIVEWLLSLGADVSAADTDGWTPLHGAAAGKDLATAKVLHKAGGDIKERRKNGRTVLYEAAVNGQREIVEWLLSLGADVSAADTDGWTPLHGAATKDLATAKVLHEAGGDIEARGNNGETVLYMAARSGHCDIVEWLIDEGASIDARESFGRTPLHFAIYTRRISTIQLLLLHGADVYCVDGFGRSSLDWIKTDKKLLDSVGVLPAESSTPDSAAQICSLRQSVHRLTAHLLENNAGNTSPGYHELGHCLIFLNEEAEALTAFEQQICPSLHGSQIAHEVMCSKCQQVPMIGIRYVCKSCPDMDLCEKCMSGYHNDSSPMVCARHEFLSVPGSDWPGHDVGFVNALHETALLWSLRIQRTSGGGGAAKFQRKGLSAWDISDAIAALHGGYILSPSPLRLLQLQKSDQRMPVRTERRGVCDVQDQDVDNCDID